MDSLVVITGGTKGIGKALVEKFLAHGFSVSTCARNSEDLEKLKLDLNKKYPNANLHVFSADLSRKESCEEFIKFTNSLNKRIEVLVNNTGVFIQGQIHEEEDGVLEQMMNTNLYSAYHITRGFVKQMKTDKQGYIFNICSTASITPYVNGGSYCISKYALMGMTKVLREEMKEHNVKVSAVLPGATFTASWEGVGIPEERFMKSEDVADAIWGAYELSDRVVMEEILLRPQLGDL